MIPASVMAIQTTTSVFKTNSSRSCFTTSVLSFHKTIMAYSLMLLILCKDKAVNVPVTGYNPYMDICQRAKEINFIPFTLHHYKKTKSVRKK